MHRIQPPHLALPRMRCLLDLAGLHRPAGVARMDWYQPAAGDGYQRTASDGLRPVADAKDS